MRKTNALLLLASLFACVRDEQTALLFKKPVVVQLLATDSLSVLSLDFMNRYRPEFLGKSLFSDTLTCLGADEHLLLDEEPDYIDSEEIGMSDSTATDSLEIVPDYATVIARKAWNTKKTDAYYPVYLINQSAGMKVIALKDGHGFGIQEALDSNGIWRPIEFRGSEFCGKGYYGLKLRRWEYAVLLFPKYQGSFKTKLRVRIKNGENLYVSQSFDGTINERQFYMKKDDITGRKLPEYPFERAEMMEWSFYGARPIEWASAGKH